MSGVVDIFGTGTDDGARWSEFEPWAAWLAARRPELPLAERSGGDCWSLEYFSEMFVSQARVRRWPGHRALLGFVRHALLPEQLAWWLVRREWDEDDSLVDAEELLRRAEAVDERCRYAKDIPVGRAAVQRLDSVREAGRGEVLAAVTTVLDDLGACFSHGPMTLRGFVAGAPAEVPAMLEGCWGEDAADLFFDMMDRGDDEEPNFAAWRERCRRAQEDPTAYAEMAAVLGRFNVMNEP